VFSREKLEMVSNKPVADENPEDDIPEKEILSVEFKNLSHELGYDPVVTKLWEKVARFTSDLKKETFGGRENEGIF
jgi:hypothetical protein